ncbi:MAG: hypothetical protein JETT_2299 [Candidatus Jettenia ecosi]|uniref:Uncharacterized protein n=1 Tax=Candidatus Jettenia ecosi TaxID=2494326 RepID=A0A533Q9X5_9BACT|nr:MAG: hypothetical protein JETT_2299 [Candidatus Jettenia ecosi]
MHQAMINTNEKRVSSYEQWIAFNKKSVKNAKYAMKNEKFTVHFAWYNLHVSLPTC